MKRRQCFVQVAFKKQDNKVVCVLLLRDKNGKYAFPTFCGGFKYHRGLPQIFAINVDGKLKTGYLNSKNEGFFQYEDVKYVEARDDKLGKFQIAVVTHDKFCKLMQTGALQTGFVRLNSENKIQI